MSATSTAAQDVQPEPRPRRARKVLVAEDSPITHDLLKLLLNQRGHEVDVAMDGMQALDALRKKHYDVALLDYHLPKMDGLAVAAAIKAQSATHRPPRLIAITADPEGLLSAEQGCESFDFILPKPLDINEVGKVVEEQADIAESQASGVTARPAPEKSAPVAAATTAAPTASILVGLRHKFLSWPEDLDATRFSSRAMQATLGDPRFDAIAIRAPATLDDLAVIWQHKALFALPVIDLTGTLGKMADLDASKFQAHETVKIDRLIQRFQDTRHRLHRDILLSEDLSDRLLGRIFVSGKPLTAAIDPGSRTCVTYNVTLAPDQVVGESAGLYERGLLTRDFVERFHVCSRCSSERLHVRDGCAKCHSSNLVEEEYLHHFRCGYQGPKSAFERGLNLVCPKCERRLGELGVDHDHAARMVVCRTCGHSDSGPVVGMVCLDCSCYHEWDSCETRDAFTYRLTDQGYGYAEYGRSFLGLFQKPLRFEELPVELIQALNEAAKRYNENKLPFTLINIFYKNERAITTEHGVQRFAEARDQFIAKLRTVLPGSNLVVKGPSSYDFALLPDIGPKQVGRESPRIEQQAAASLPFDIGATLKAFGPEDF